MPDAYQAVRSIAFPDLCNALGIPFTFKTRKSGTEWYGKCPLHPAQTNNTSFSFNTDGRYFCFSCSAKGKGAIDFTRAIRSVGFKDAVEFLSGIKSSPAIQKPVPETETGEIKPYTGSYEKYKVDCPWLKARVPNQDVLDRYGVFCYRNNKRQSKYNGRVLIPFKDLGGVVWAYMGRAVTTGQPESDNCTDSNNSKYLIPSGFPKSRFLFGGAELKAGMFGQAPLKCVFLVESPWTVMKFASMGLACVAAYGWSVSEEQIQLLKQIGKAVLYLPDKNKRESVQTVLALLATQVWTKFPDYPAEDPEQLSKFEALALL